jgi:hypothetical protein
MRLICPNCGAQYEVAGDVIPTVVATFSAFQLRHGSEQPVHP